MAWTPFLTNLRDVLADIYYEKDMARVVVEEAGIPKPMIGWSEMPLVLWQNILRLADQRDEVHKIVAVALQDNPGNVYLQNAAQGDLNAVSGKDIHTQVDWKVADDSGQLEKIMGKRSTLLDVYFLEKGMQAARSVARIVMAEGSGTGFLVQGGLLITNHHVLPSADVARGAKAEFNYQKTAAGLDAMVESFALAPDAGFATSQEDDWSAVRLLGDAAATWGVLTLKPNTIAQEETINIIQHPGGGPKQIALYHNIVTYADDHIVQYLTDTLPGSSGSPCFNNDWELVALHHSGGFLRQPGAKEKLFRNEGIHIDRVVQGVQNAGLL